jgi:hypothetical protein
MKGSNALDSARAAEAAKDDGIVQCGGGFHLLVCDGDGVVTAVPNLVLLVVVAIVLVVFAQGLAPRRTPLVVNFNPTIFTQSTMCSSIQILSTYTCHLL